MSQIKASNDKEQKHFDYLERLRKSGITNMWHAAPFLRDAYPKDFPGKEEGRKKAGEVLLRWIELHKEESHAISEKD